MTNSYTDYSRVPPEKVVPVCRGLQAKEPTFPAKLHILLSNPDFQYIATWLPHGRSWTILQQKAFEERVIPIYFSHGRYASFARQVNGWGFHRITHGSDYNSYYHELFLRGLHHLCKKMRRLKITKDGNGKKRGGDQSTPDFYALSREFPLPESIPPKYSVLAPSKIIEAELELAMLEKRCAAISEQLQHTTTHQLRNPSTHPLLQLSKSAQIDMNPLDTILIQQQLSGDQTLASLRPGRFLGSVDPASAFANLLAALNPIRALAGGPTVAAAPDLSVVTRDFTSNGADALPRQLRLNSLLPQSQDRQITHSGGTPSLLQLLQSLSNNVGDIQPRTLIQTAHQGNALRDTETQPQLFGQNIGANAPFQYVTYATTSQACRPQQRSTDVGKLLHLLSLLQQHQNGTW